VKTLVSIGLLSVLSWLPKSTNEETNQWKHTREGEGIVVYTRGGESSGFKEIKATVTMDCSLQTLVATLTDYGNYKNWIYSTSQSYTITKVSDFENIVYQYIDAPWPLSDRDVCMRIKLAQDPKTLNVTIDSKSENSLKELVSGVVRVPYNFAHWDIVPIAKNKLSCTYTLKTNPGGAIPAWIANMFITDGPYDSILKLKSVEIKKSQYTSAKNAKIKEKY
jgi:hypothetical protein